MATVREVYGIIRDRSGKATIDDWTFAAGPPRVAVDEHVTLEPGDRVVVLGVGSTLRGDDAAGIEVARRLADHESDRLRVVEGGTAPENYTAVVKRSDPDHVLLIDAIDFGGEPGDVKQVDPSALAQTSFSSHAYPLTLLTDFIEMETGATITLLGIQPETVEESETISPSVEAGIDRAVETLLAALSDPNPE